MVQDNGGEEMKITIIEEDDDMRFHRPHNPLTDGWICPYCGKRVYSMEVHPCNQPWCGQTRDDGWFPGGAACDECRPEDRSFCWNYGGDK